MKITGHYQDCGKKVAVRNGKIVTHGFKQNGYSNNCQTQCGGTGYEPIEVSCSFLTREESSLSSQLASAGEFTKWDTSDEARVVSRMKSRVALLRHKIAKWTPSELVFS